MTEACSSQCSRPACSRSVGRLEALLTALWTTASRRPWSADEAADDRRGLGAVGDVAAQDDRHTAGGANLFGDLLGRLGATDAETDHGSGPTEGGGDAAAHPCGGAGDQHDPSVERAVAHGTITSPRSAPRKEPVSAAPSGPGQGGDESDHVVDRDADGQRSGAQRGDVECASPVRAEVVGSRATPIGVDGDAPGVPSGGPLTSPAPGCSRPRCTAAPARAPRPQPSWGARGPAGRRRAARPTPPGGRGPRPRIDRSAAASQPSSSSSTSGSRAAGQPGRGTSTRRSRSGPRDRGRRARLGPPRARPVRPPRREPTLRPQRPGRPTRPPRRVRSDRHDLGASADERQRELGTDAPVGPDHCHGLARQRGGPGFTVRARAPSSSVCGASDPGRCPKMLARCT